MMSVVPYCLHYLYVLVYWEFFLTKSWIWGNGLLEYLNAPSNSHLPQIVRVHVRLDSIWCHPSSLIRTNPCTHRDVLSCAHSIGLSRHAGLAQLNHIRERLDGIAVPVQVGVRIGRFVRWVYWTADRVHFVAGSTDYDKAKGNIKFNHLSLPD